MILGLHQAGESNHWFNGLTLSVLAGADDDASNQAAHHGCGLCCAFPHLRTSNSIESTFATVRHRTIRNK